MCRSYFRDEEEEKMRFSDQIDPGNGALRSWQAESERLLFDQSTRSRWGRGGGGLGGGVGEMGCHSAVKPSQAAASLSAPQTLHHPACSGARDACSAVTSHSYSNSLVFPPRCKIKTKNFELLLMSVEGSNITRLGKEVQWSRKKLTFILINHHTA